MPDSTPSPHPGPALRGERLLARLDLGFARLDAWLGRWLPVESNVLAQSGRSANLALVVAVATGVLLLPWYEASLHGAHASVAAMQYGLGGWVRALHRYSSDLAVLLLALHALRMLLARKLSGARWLPWVSGVGLAGLVWFIGWTGLWLVWDQPAKAIAQASITLLDALPIFGEPLERFLLTDRLVPSLIFFVVFFLHMLLPLLIAVGLAFHLARLSRVRLLPDRDITIGLLVSLALVALAWPAPLDAPARMTEQASQLTVDVWFTAPLALALRLGSGGLWASLGGGLLLAALLPWILGLQRRPTATLAPAAAQAANPGPDPSAPFQTSVDAERCHACTQCTQDCPFDAVRMVPRTGPGLSELQAWVDPDRCVGCGVCVGSCDSEAMNLVWLPTRPTEAEIEARAKLPMPGGAARRVALVAGDIDGPPASFAQATWEQRLPGYHIFRVPTASWVRPKLVERLLKAGCAEVLVVRDARGEAAARDGNGWVLSRLVGERKPAFRPSRAGGSQNWRVVDYDPARPKTLLTVVPRAAHKPALSSVLALGLLLFLTLGVARLSHLTVSNPASAAPEFVVSFKAFGASESPADISKPTEDSRPVHMRGAPAPNPGGPRCAS